MQIKYLGITTGRCTVQGPSGPVTHDVPQGGALALFRVDGFTEGSHAVLGGLANNGAVSGGPNLSPEEELALTVIHQLRESLANDGKLSSGEVAGIVGKILGHTDFTSTVSKSVGKWIGLVK